MGRARNFPMLDWGEIRPRHAAADAAIRAVAESELGSQLYPYAQVGWVCRIHARPINVSAEHSVPAIYLSWDRVFERFLLEVYDGRGEPHRHYNLTEVCSPERLSELLSVLGPELLRYESQAWPRHHWPRQHWPETEAAYLTAPGPWILERVMARDRYRVIAACFALEAPEVLARFSCRCAGVAGELLSQRGDAWLYPSPARLAAVEQAADHPCRRACRIGGFVRQYLDYAQGRTHVVPYLQQIHYELGEWLQNSDDLAQRLGVEAWRAMIDARQRKQSMLLRDLVGNPFSPVELPPGLLTWREGTINRLARGIYDQEAFDDMPVLADALEEAGEAPGELLAHCRGPGPHYRGCWALALLAPETTARLAARTKYADAADPGIPAMETEL